MRPRHVLTPLALALVARVIVRYVRKRRGVADRRARAAAFAADPRDPVQSLDDVAALQVMPLDVDAASHSDVEAAADLAGLEIELDEVAARDAAEFADTELPIAARPRDAGDLYGAHTPAAVDRVHPDDDRAFDEGQNWLEALETDAVEGGADPERALDDIIDDEDVLSPPHRSLKRDIPVADHGAGGRRGL